MNKTQTVPNAALSKRTAQQALTPVQKEDHCGEGLGVHPWSTFLVEVGL